MQYTKFVLPAVEGREGGGDGGGDVRGDESGQGERTQNHATVTATPIVSQRPPSNWY